MINIFGHENTRFTLIKDHLVGYKENMMGQQFELKKLRSVCLSAFFVDNLVSIFKRTSKSWK